jgi:hypothetical protein
MHIDSGECASSLITYEGALVVTPNSQQNDPLRVELHDGAVAYFAPGAKLAKVAENADVFRRLDAAPAATPEQLLRAAKRYVGHPATNALAHQLSAQAMAMIVHSPNVTGAVERIADTEVEWSIFSDIWDAVSDFFGGGGPSGRPNCIYKCQWFTWWESCAESWEPLPAGNNDDWTVVGGFCFGF